MKIKSFFYVLAAFSLAAGLSSCGNDEPLTPITPVTPGGDESTFFSETFASGLGKFTIENIKKPESIEKIWFPETYKESSYAKGSTGLSANFVEAEAILISPEVDLSKAQTAAITFQHAHRFAGDPAKELTLVIRESGAGAASWETLPIMHSDQTNWTFISTASDISKYAGKKIQFGFRYIGTTTHNAGWEIKNVSVVAQVAATLNTKESSFTVSKGKTHTVIFTTDSPATAEFTTSDATVATVDNQGVVTGVAAGNAEITVKVPASGAFKEASAKVAVTVVDGEVIDYASLPFVYSAENLAKDTEIKDVALPVGLTYDDTVAASNYKAYKGYLGLRCDAAAYILKTNAAYGKIVFVGKGQPSDNVSKGTIHFEGSADGTSYTEISSCGFTATADTTINAANTVASYRYLRIRLEKVTGNFAVKSIEVRAAGALDPCATPSISCADDKVTITCATAGAKIYYTTDGTEPTVASTQYTAPFDITSDVTVKAIAKADGYDVSAVATAECKYGVKALKTVAEIVTAISAGTSESPVSFTASLTDFTLTYIRDKYYYFQDASHSVIGFSSTGLAGMAVGDRITGTFEGTGYVYYGIPEITVLTLKSTTSKTTGVTIAPKEVSASDLESKFRDLLGTRVILKGVEFKVGFTADKAANGTITYGGKDFTIRNVKGVAVEAGAKGDVTCYVDSYSDALQLQLCEQSWFVADASAPVLSISPASANVAATATEAKFTVTSNIEWNLTASTGATATPAGNEVTVTFPANTTESVKTYTVKVTPKDSEHASLEKTFTVTQAAVSSSNTIWSDDFSKCTLSSSALTKLSGSKTGFTGDYSAISTTYSMAGAIRIGKSSGGGSITTPVLSTISGTKSLTITFKAEGWNNKSCKITLTANGAGTVTEGETAVPSSTTMAGNSPALSASAPTYTFHVTGATSATTIKIDTNLCIGIDDLEISVD